MMYSISLPSLAIAFFSGLTAAQTNNDNPFRFVSAATLFNGGPSPIVNTGYARFQGKNDDNTNSSNYLGVTYAKAPRFDHAILFGDKLSGIQNVTDYGPACSQHQAVSEFAPSDANIAQVAGLLEGLPLGQEVLKQAEECLTINIQRPQNTNLKNLPVLVWIHGGGFEAGESNSVISESTAINGVFYQGANLVKRSIAMGQPIVFTSINYRLAHFGFTASREFAKAGLMNLGFEDQRVALQWIQKNIAAFGGNPGKVTIMGESAGSWSVSAHLLANGGNNGGLFHGAVGISGGPLKVDGPTRQQALFDSLCQYVGCGSSANKVDCLRKAPYEKIYNHMNTVNYFLGFRSLASAWTIRPDGKYFTQSLDKLAAAGKIANVPVMYGDMRDEGPLFSLITAQNITTTEQVKDYFKTYWWPNVTETQLDRLMTLYPQDPTQGSPFGTGLLYALPPQYKRLAALIGDYSFQAQRRALLAKVKAPKWNYLTEVTIPTGSSFLSGALGLTGATAVPVLGSFHASDVFFYWFGTIPATVSQNTYHLMGVLVSFTHNQDPNKHGMPGLPTWPQYDTTSLATYHFQESGVDVIRDDYRQEQMAYINQISDSIHI